MTTGFFGAIADDFTGATDLAAMLARAGVPVTLRIGVPEAGAEATAFEVIALKIRTEPVDDALAQARAAHDWLAAAGVRRVFWKYCSTFDSTPRGNIGPVAEMLMRATGVERTVHVPAFPENGRRVFMGNLFVGDLPLDAVREVGRRRPIRAQEAQLYQQIGVARAGGVDAVSLGVPDHVAHHECVVRGLVQ